MRRPSMTPVIEIIERSHDPVEVVKSLFRMEIGYLREKGNTSSMVVCDSFTYELAVEHKVKDPERYKAGTPISMTGDPYYCKHCGRMFNRLNTCNMRLQTQIGRNRKLKAVPCVVETKNSAMARRARWLLKKQFDNEKEGGSGTVNGYQR